MVHSSENVTSASLYVRFFQFYIAGQDAALQSAMVWRATMKMWPIREWVARDGTQTKIWHRSSSLGVRSNSSRDFQCSMILIGATKQNILLTQGHYWCFKHLCFGKNRQFICPTCSSYHSVSKPHPSSKYKEHDWSKRLHATGQANATKGRQKHKEVSRSGGSDTSQMPMWGGRLGFNRRPH